MIAFIDRIKDYLSEPVFPPAVFHLTRTWLSGIHDAKKEKKVTAHFILPLMTGPIVGAFPAPGAVSPEIAYRWAFGAIALTLAAGLAIYLTAKDAKPSAGA